LNSRQPRNAGERRPAPNVDVTHGKISRYIESGVELWEYHSSLHQRGVETIALDMEGDQGRLRYAYSISIFQCFDGSEAVIIDVLSMGNTPELQRFLTDPAIVKIMFACSSDIFMAQNVLGCTIAPVFDIALGQKLLNLPIDITEHLKIDKKLKEKFQKANWLNRPIQPNLLDYAIFDVLELFKIANRVADLLHRKKLTDVFESESARLAQKDFRIDQMHRYTEKFPGYNRLRPAQRRAAAEVWIFRELLGKHFDRPVAFVLSKESMLRCIREPGRIMEALDRELNRNRPEHKRMKLSLIEKYYQEAMRIAEKGA
jgi:ribonuclease D